MKNKELTIIDYGLGNLLSLKRAFEFIGASVIITNEPKLIANSSRVVLPGVGAFGTAMNFIKDLKVEESIISIAKKEFCPYAGYVTQRYFIPDNVDFDWTAVGISIQFPDSP